MGKKYLKGFSDFGFFPVTADTEDSYTTGNRTRVPSARTCSPTNNKQDYTINADDGIWDSGSELTDITNEVTFAELDLPTLAEMTGATANEDGSIDESTLDIAPLIAINYKALRADGGYRLYRYYACKVTDVKVSHTTKGESTDAQSYTVTFKCIPRKCDKKIKSTIDIAQGEALTWLDSIESYPVATLPEPDPEPTGDGE